MMKIMNYEGMNKDQMNFVFDLDSTITRCEILPEIARSIDMEERIAELTELSMRGNVSFEENFRMRVGMLSIVPISQARSIVNCIPLNERIVDFILRYQQRCNIITGNLDIWIEELISRIGMKDRCICSKGIAKGDLLLGVKNVVDKYEAARTLKRPFVAVGDGSNDIGMLQIADIGIAFGGVRKLQSDIIEAADLVFYEENELCDFLERIAIV